MYFDTFLFGNSVLLVMEEIIPVAMIFSSTLLQSPERANVMRLFNGPLVAESSMRFSTVLVSYFIILSWMYGVCFGSLLYRVSIWVFVFAAPIVGINPGAGMNLYFYFILLMLCYSYLFLPKEKKQLMHEKHCLYSVSLSGVNRICHFGLLPPLN